MHFLKNKKLFLKLFSLTVILITAGLWYSGKFHSPRPNIIYIMIDTLRADHLGFNSYPRNTSPSIDKFAYENSNFSYAFTTAPWTPPSVASQLSGLYSATHKMLPPRSREQAKTNSVKFNSSILTIPEKLAALGYVTGAISSNPWISSTYGFNEEFQNFEYVHRAKAEIVNESAFKMLEKFAAQEKPFFIYLHYLDPHNPYAPPPEYTRMFDGQPALRNYPEKILSRVNRYDGEIRYLDDQLEKLFKYLKDNNLYNDSIIIFTSDHGEQFEEHGDFGHGYQLFNEEVRVPLIIKGLKNKPQLIEHKVSLIDIFPTILDKLNVSVPASLQGISLQNRKEIMRREGIMTEISRVYKQKAFITNRLKLIVGSDKPEIADQIDEKNIFNFPIGLYYKSMQLKEKQTHNDHEKILASTNSLKTTHSIANKDGEYIVKQQAEVNEESLDQLQSLGYF